MQRNVLVISTSNGGEKNYLTAAETWGALRKLISADYDLSVLKATENVNKTTLEDEDSVLPTEDFILYLRPEKTKSGN